MKIGWAFTGAGHLLRESVEAMEELANDHDITVFLSHAAEEVLKMYGLYDRVLAVTGGRYRELASDSNQKFSFPITGRLSLGKYDLLIVSPTTANTVAKIVYGISDTLVTNAVAQAGKGKVRTLMVPVDIEEEDIETVLPSKLEKTKCKSCDKCEAALVCPNAAIIPHEEIDLLKCIGCGACKDICPYDAVSEGKIITMHMRPIDILNTRKLEKMEGIEIFENPSKLLEKLL
ncbi:dihydromethanopterin reductase (acceptor) [Methanobrevibacter olleyae]|uniref:Archaeoflavoprotein AfpA n=1 Tax=Methanobrevibacter olleyae TaxID=294671 RepID=A0A126R1Y0_METOL|nr:dihydromethanopterin reductase (acceptor) [Methanobrevibacter olleyae]AMK16107.1 archaeoflavoprotein AfpA [Methanobrevibacter olleyae]SFL32921.1 dihydromethanopterin reductase (acceptor) [Methanobrevibacter olleyae]